jgi:hypothetical protein
MLGPSHDVDTPWEQDPSFNPAIITNLANILRKQEAHINGLKDSLGTAAVEDSLEDLLESFAYSLDIEIDSDANLSFF